MYLRNLIFFVLLLFSICLFDCASRGRPGGGPVDKIPPEIIHVFPSADSTNIKQIETIEIFFNERMDEASVERAIFISPPLKYESDWSGGGEELMLYVSDTLKPDITYVITVGSGAKDSHNNRLKESFQFAFATGEFIDRGKISGTVYGIKPKEMFYIYAYKIFNPDSLNPAMVKADFLSQPGEDGSFKLDYLSLGNYRIFVIEDQNKNLLLDADYERVGIPPRDVLLDSTRMEFQPLNFRITKADTTAPFITGARSIEKTKILLRVSEIVQNLNPKMLTIVDTLKFDTLKVLGIVRNKDESNQFFIFTNNQDSAAGYSVSVSSLIDTTGNIQQDTSLVMFSASTQIDTNKFLLTKTSPGDSAKNVKLDASIVFQFSKAIDTLRFLNAFTIMDADSQNVSGRWKWENLLNAEFTPKPDFLPGKEYLFSLKVGIIHSLWQDTLADTVITHRIFTRSEDDFGSLSGIYDTEKPLTSDVYIDIIPVQRRQKSLRIKVQPDKRFISRWIDEGKYRLGGFMDLNNNGKYSLGKLYPFQFAEPFYIQSDTIRIRKRWEVSDLKYSIPGMD